MFQVSRTGKRLASHYALLGISSNATQAEIKKAYFKKTKEYHPDKNPGNKNLNNKFIELQDAYKILSNLQSRREYDSRRNFGNSDFGYTTYSSNKPSYTAHNYYQPSYSNPKYKPKINTGKNYFFGIAFFVVAVVGFGYGVSLNSDVQNHIDNNYAETSKLKTAEGKFLKHSLVYRNINELKSINKPRRTKEKPEKELLAAETNFKMKPKNEVKVPIPTNLQTWREDI